MRRMDCGIAAHERSEAFIRRAGYDRMQRNGQYLVWLKKDMWPVSNEPTEHEIYISNIPNDCYEDELFPHVVNCGELYNFRLMLHFSGKVKGSAYAMYFYESGVQAAIKKLNDLEIRQDPVVRLSVKKSINNCRLIIRSIPIDIGLINIAQNLLDNSIDLKEALVKTDRVSYDTILKFQTHRATAVSRKKLEPFITHNWKPKMTVDWADNKNLTVAHHLFDLLITFESGKISMKKIDGNNNEINTRRRPILGQVDRVSSLRSIPLVDFQTPRPYHGLLKIPDKYDNSACIFDNSHVCNTLNDGNVNWSCSGNVQESPIDIMNFQEMLRIESPPILNIGNPPLMDYNNGGVTKFEGSRFNCDYSYWSNFENVRYPSACSSNESYDSTKAKNSVGLNGIDVYRNIESKLSFQETQNSSSYNSSDSAEVNFNTDLNYAGGPFNGSNLKKYFSGIREESVYGAGSPSSQGLYNNVSEKKNEMKYEVPNKSEQCLNNEPNNYSLFPSWPPYNN